jgi:hypothetical protein
MHKNYKMMKVFDCQWNPGMPKDVKESFFRIFEDNRSNDVVVEYTIHGENFEDEDDEWAQDHKKLDAWLIENGAMPAPHDDEEGETVLIKHWW